MKRTSRKVVVGGTRLLTKFGDVKDLYRDSTVGLRPKVWTRDQNWKYSQKWHTEEAQMLDSQKVVTRSCSCWSHDAAKFTLRLILH